ncbi:MAG: hypothetical protein OEW12_07315 [Deltaproteobacteria bacterium]|nr:hypothetical protein [Deltaproteobacteria bacterium]
MPMDLVMTVVLTITIIIWLAYARRKGIHYLRRNLIALMLAAAGIAIIEITYPRQAVLKRMEEKAAAEMAKEAAQAQSVQDGAAQGMRAAPPANPPQGQPPAKNPAGTKGENKLDQTQAPDPKRLFLN